jgi:hypothetical protein
VNRAPSQTSALTAGERALYHQVHPLKLATDITTAIASLSFSRGMPCGKR